MYAHNAHHLKSLASISGYRGKVKAKEFTLTAPTETEFMKWTQEIRKSIEGKSLRKGVRSGQHYL